MDQKQFKTMENILRNGTILLKYGQKSLLSVNPAFDIDKIRFSIVKLGTGGKDALDFYLPVEEMRRLCSEIDSGAALKRIAEDTGNYPSAYVWTAGKDGTKKLALGGGKNGARVQISLAGESGRKADQVGVTVPELKQLSFYFSLVSGLIPVRDGSYYDFLYRVYWSEGAGKRQNDRERFTEDAVAVAAAEAVSPAPDDTPSAPPEPSPRTEEFRLEVVNVCEDCGDFYSFPALNGDEGVDLLFRKGDASGISWFQAFCEKVRSCDYPIHFTGQRSGNTVLFLELIKE